MLHLVFTDNKVHGKHGKPAILENWTNPEQVSYMPCKSLFILQGTVLRMIISRNLHGGMHYVVHFVFITFDLVGLCLPEKETNFYY